MATFAEHIEAATHRQPIEAIAIGPYGWDGYSDNEMVPADKQNRVLTWREAKPLLGYEYSSSYGAPQCHAVTVWTRDWIVFVSQYDGSTSIHALPRNPRDIKPEMPGG